ncbi:MAG: SUMF1/EgtB/PvdO family nonheme iron enzyme [Flavobacteriales bacterium]
MSKTEVSNQFYRDFLSSISKKDSLSNLPESNRVYEYAYGEPQRGLYFRHPAYNNYPVVNITHKQAKAYCNWLTERLNHNFPNQKVIVRLPTEKEWEFAAKGGNKYAIYPWGHETMRVKEGKNKGKLQANFVLTKGITMADEYDITAPVTAYWPNDFGLYNMSGNVSEMVDKVGLVKGGSWKNRADWLQIQKQQFVYSASPEVGFRYIVEVLKLPKPKKYPKTLSIDKKFFKKYFAEINDTLSVGKYEVTNYLYQDVISNVLGISLLPNKHDKNWKDLFPYGQVWMNNYYLHPNFRNHPVVNIDPKDVQSFCEWLEKYYFYEFNEKVEFRLPTEKEWELAARGRRSKSAYPWGGPYLRNSKGCYLANFNPKMSEDENVHGYDTLSLNNFFHSYFTDLHDYDGEAVIAPVDSYFPNDYGIYNMAGNVAEMVLDSNFTKGGSWKSKSYYLQINSKEEWNKQANPFTGFRIVMIKKKP